MKVVILAGGYGTRISEESVLKPKPMIRIGEQPILWHIMKIYSAHGLNDFIICLGYKGEMIIEYFANYHYHFSDITFDLGKDQVQIHQKNVEPWRVTLVHTGKETMTGGRIKRIKDHIGNETFCMTYGDGVSDVNITGLIEYHKKQNVLGTLTAVKQPGRFGTFPLKRGSNKITQFREKTDMDGSWVNGGFFVLEPGVMDYIDGDATIWEQEPMRRLSAEGNLAAYRHTGYWQNMDTLWEKNLLEKKWLSGDAPWKIW